MPVWVVRDFPLSNLRNKIALQRLRVLSGDDLRCMEDMQIAMSYYNEEGLEILLRGKKLHQARLGNQRGAPRNYFADHQGGQKQGYRDLQRDMVEAGMSASFWDKYSLLFDLRDFVRGR